MPKRKHPSVVGSVGWRYIHERTHKFCASIHCTTNAEQCFFVCECVRLCVCDELMSIRLQNTIKGVRFCSSPIFCVCAHRNACTQRWFTIRFYGFVCGFGCNRKIQLTGLINLRRRKKDIQKGMKIHEYLAGKYNRNEHTHAHARILCVRVEF